ncbi:MAG: response regulator [Gammaproteobacteria bacterium]|jgi:CheY-like chemotaxis protein|nr:response regulator [Gammaproteobacteria bacterium]
MIQKLKGKRILILEDEFVVAISLEAVLVDEGAIPIGPAANCSEALTLLDAHTVDAAVIDVNLGGELSTSVAERLRLASIPFVVTTGYGENNTVSAMGGHAVLDKPYLPEVLIDTLAGILAGASTA